MTDSVLEILNYALLALLYLFFARVLWAVWSEVRGPRTPAASRPARSAAPPVDPTVPAPAPPQARSDNKRAKRGQVTRLVVSSRTRTEGRGSSRLNQVELSIGRLATCTICIPTTRSCPPTTPGCTPIERRSPTSRISAPPTAAT
jgi:hypothetical protein